MLAWVRTASGESLQPIVDKLFAHDEADESLVRRTTSCGCSARSCTRRPRSRAACRAAQREQLYGLVAGQFPATDERLNRELALLIGYSGQAPGIGELLDAMPKGNDNQELQLQYLYAPADDEAGVDAGAEGRSSPRSSAARRSGAAARSSSTSSGSSSTRVADLYATDEEKQLLYEKAPDFSPLTPEELKAIQERQAARPRRPAGAAAAAPATPLAARTQGRVVSRQEMLEEAVFQPQQNLSADEGRTVFQANCASCHRFGTLGTDHGVAGLNLTASPLRSAKYSLLEAIMFPNRKIAPEHETTVIVTTDGKTIQGLVLRESGPSVSLLTREGTPADVAKGADQVAAEGEDVADDGGDGRHDEPDAVAQPARVPDGAAGRTQAYGELGRIEVPVAANPPVLDGVEQRATGCVCDVLPPPCENRPKTDRMIRLRFVWGTRRRLAAKSRKLPSPNR